MVAGKRSKADAMPLRSRVRKRIETDSLPCLRCSKHEGQLRSDSDVWGPDFLPRRCDKTKFKKCSYCTKNNSECLVIPKPFRRSFRVLRRHLTNKPHLRFVEYPDAQENESDTDYDKRVDEATGRNTGVIAARKALLRKYIASVQSYLVNKAKMGGTAKPTTVVEVGILLLERLTKMHHTLKQMSDTSRAAANLPALEDSGDEQDEEDADEWMGLEDSDDEE